jgi:hypothetical protein
MGVPYACLACRPPAVAVSEKILAIWGIALCSRSSKSDSSERPAQTLAAWQLASQMTTRRALSFYSAASLRQRLRREPKLKQAASLLCNLRLGSPACLRRRLMVVSRGRNVGSPASSSAAPSLFSRTDASAGACGSKRKVVGPSRAMQHADLTEHIHNVDSGAEYHGAEAHSSWSCLQRVVAPPQAAPEAGDFGARRL